jgi:glyoxylase-like metal-dependent hydrolase (beta-lactamase superfamily II)
MGTKLDFDMDFEPHYGEAVPVSGNVLRLTARNPSPFTFHGTNSYIIGTKSLAVIDPGPDDDEHFANLVRAIDGRPVTHIFVSHTHKDHSPLASRLKEITGAPVMAEGPHRPARTLRTGEVNPLDASADMDFQPDIALCDGQTIETEEWAITALHTPGHTANHVVFALKQGDVLFSADHVMGWATSIVAPPDGAMSDYMRSLQRLIEREDALYLPGHGGRIGKPRSYVRGLQSHRRMRERAIADRLAKGDRTIGEIVKAIYKDIDPRLHGAAGLSVLAHLEDLVASGRAESEQDVSIDAVYFPK